MTCGASLQPLDNQTIGTYFDGNEAVGLLHPGLMVWAQIRGGHSAERSVLP